MIFTYFISLIELMWGFIHYRHQSSHCLSIKPIIVVSCGLCLFWFGFIKAPYCPFFHVERGGLDGLCPVCCMKIWVLFKCLFLFSPSSQGVVGLFNKAVRSLLGLGSFFRKADRMEKKFSTPFVPSSFLKHRMVNFLSTLKFLNIFFLKQFFC